MDISAGVLCGVIAMLGWGVSDLLIAKSVRKSTIFQTFLWAQVVSVAFLLLFSSQFSAAGAFSPGAVGLAALGGLLGVVANLLFFKGLQIGKAAIIMPVAACWAIVTVVLGVFFLHERLSPLQALGIFVAIAGSVLASFKSSDLRTLKLKRHARGVQYAVLAALAYGVMFVVIDILVGKIGWFLSTLCVEVAMVFFVLLYAGTADEGMAFPKRAWLLVLLVGVLDAVAYLAYGRGVTSELASIVAPISAASPAIGVLLARVCFRERLEVNQKIGIVGVLASLVLLSL